MIYWLMPLIGIYIAFLALNLLIILWDWFKYKEEYKKQAGDDS